jgi:hypothetical protein
MRRTILLSLIALLAVSAATEACAQRRGGGGFGFARRAYGFSHGRGVLPFGFGYGYMPYDSGAAYDYAPPPVILVQAPPLFVQAAAPAIDRSAWHPVVTEYKWPAAASSSSAQPTSSEAESQNFGIVLKNGSTLSAVSVFASDDGLRYVDPDARHMRIAMSEVDRAATLKLNRARNLNLYLPAAE